MCNKAFLHIPAASLNHNDFYKLIEYREDRAKTYTSEVVSKQLIESASIAWRDKDYQKVIMNLKKIEVTTMTRSLKQKLQYAQRQVKLRDDHNIK